MADINELLAHLPKNVRESVVRASEVEKTLYPVASRGLTQALGGGIGKGRMTLFYGNFSSGKSMILQQSIGLWQEMGLSCAWVDAEEAFAPDFAEQLGVNTDELIVVKKRSTGAVTDIVTPLLENGLDILVIDSLSGLLAEVFVDSDGGVQDFDKMKQIGAHAKSISMMINALHYANKHAAIILVSQTTTQINQTYVKQVPHGGVKVPFACSQIVKLTSSGTEAKAIMGQTFIGNQVIETPVGRPVEFLVEKNKLGPQGRSGKYNIYYDGPLIGIDTTDELVTMAVTAGVVRKAGAWFKFNDQQWQGQPALVRAIKESPELEAAIEAELALAMNGGLVE